MTEHHHDHDHDQPTPTGRPRKQEQEDASTDITEVAPGILRSQLPISMPGLGHVNCYLMEDERGVAVVDPGLPGEESWLALVDRLGRGGVPRRRHPHDRRDPLAPRSLRRSRSPPPRDRRRHHHPRDVPDHLGAR